MVTTAGREFFQEAFRRYMDGAEFAHVAIGGRLGQHTADEFRRGDDFVSLSVAGEGQSHSKVVVHSDTVPVEPLVFDALTEGLADFLEPFCRSAGQEDSRERVSSLIKALREAFDEVLDDYR